MKRSKYILILITTLIFTECVSKSSDNANTIEKTIEKTTKVDLEKNKIQFKQNEFKRNELVKIAATDKFSKSDLNNIKFVWKGVKEIYELEGIEFRRDRNRKLDPFENENTVAIMTDYSDEIKPKPYGERTVLLSMNFHSHEVYTIWETEQDSFMFKQILKPIQNGKYSSSLIDSIFEVQGKKIISGMTLGGEGGETWNSFWVKQVKNDSILQLEQTPIKYNLHLEAQRYVIDYNYPNITRTTFRDSIGDFRDTIRSIINVNELVETNGL